MEIQSPACIVEDQDVRVTLIVGVPGSLVWLGLGLSAKAPTPTADAPEPRHKLRLIK